MSMHDDYQAGLEGRTNYGNKHTVAYHRGLADRQGGFAGAIGGSAPNVIQVLPAPMLLALSFFLATVGILIATCLFPLGGGLTLLAYLAFYQTFKDPMVHSAMLLMVFMVPGVFLFGFTMLVESKISLNRNYRRLRHLWRIVAVPTFAYFIAIDLTDSSTTIMIVLSAFAIGTHFLSRRLDRGYPEESVTAGDVARELATRIRKRKKPDWMVSKRHKQRQAEVWDRFSAQIDAAQQAHVDQNPPQDEPRT